ncbi:C6 zinc finger domain protein [Cordyceps militaris CM01]|uniref:C6 zinc finger domain protein n=1 Tax=Cordyceps militaris (strain CM01) TaxID=983644 RepID=G3J5E1_CORMM|nr:C6 zinc finger domain protein [Cordyceps militaris CM01]EGX96002.1 C6 zinc finger domain protein [Cordyceps militaris CM01]
MVGVPGRSKACNTCLQRKIKCDLAKPHCSNCFKSKRICGGYTRKTAYIFSENVVLPAAAEKDDGTLTYQGRWKGTTKKARTPSPGLVHVEARPRLPRPADDASSELSDVDLGRALAAQRIPMMPSLWQQLHHVFLAAYMPRQGMGAADNADYVTGNWLLQLQGRSSPLPALQTAVAAFAAAQIGRAHSDARLVSQSAHLYLRSLEHLRHALAYPATRLHDDTLAACLTLGIYELTETPRPRRHTTALQLQQQENTAYSKHMIGAMMLLQLRGPDGNNTPLAHSLFLSLRRHVINTTLITHTDSFLCHDEWRARPWRVYPKNVLDRCLDCVQDLPPLQRLADEMQRGAGDAARVAAQCAALTQGSTAVLARLGEWYGTLQAQVAGPPYWSRFCTLTSAQDDAVRGKPFPVSYNFATFSTAYLLMMYWAGVMVGHWLLFVACRALAALSSEDDGGEPERAELVARGQRHREAWVAMARNMCQMTEYFLGEDMGKVGVSVALALLEGAMAMFCDGTDDWQRERAWVAEMIALTAKRLNETSMLVV